MGLIIEGLLSHTTIVFTLFPPKSFHKFGIFNQKVCNPSTIREQSRGGGFKWQKIERLIFGQKTSYYNFSFETLVETQYKSDITLFSINFFDTRSFLKHRRVPLRNDSVLPDKTISTENRDTRPLFHPYHFSISEIF